MDDDGEDDADSAVLSQDVLFLNDLDRSADVSNTVMEFHEGQSQHNRGTPLGESVRVRMYTTRQKGPYVVIIHELNKKMTPLRFSSYINQSYTSVVSVRISPGKLKITLNKLAEANHLVQNQIFKEYYVSIPADQVEVEGAFNSQDLCDLTEMNVLVMNGVGGFYNSSLPPVKILHAEQLFRICPSNLTTRIKTNTIKVIFEGQVLPNFITLEGLRINIRPFYQKPMFCDNCQQFGHTKKFCKRTPKCSVCHGKHSTAICDNPKKNEDLCPYCLTAPKHERLHCSFFEEVKEDFKLRQANIRKTRYAQAVASVRIANTQSNVQENVNTENNAFPELRNRFSTLHEEELQPSTIPNSLQVKSAGRITNPYSKVLKRSSVSSSSELHSTASKRQRPIPVNNSTPTPATGTSTVQQVQVPQYSATNKSSVNVVKTAILTFVRQAQVSEIWVSLIEAIIDPVLHAILPQLSVILGAFSPSVLTNHP